MFFFARVVWSFIEVFFCHGGLSSREVFFCQGGLSLRGVLLPQQLRVSHYHHHHNHYTFYITVKQTPVDILSWTCPGEGK